MEIGGSGDSGRFAIITIGITSRNRKDELRRTIESAFLLTPVPPILVIDDGSTDGTSAMVREFFPTVHLITYQQSAGLIARRNELADICTTAYLASIDDDAYFRDGDVLNRAARLLDEDATIGAVGLPYVNVKISDSVLQAPGAGETQSELGAYVGTAHVLRVSLFRTIGGYPTHFIRQGEESFYSLKLIDHGFRIVCLDTVPLHHQHSTKRDNSEIVYYARRNEVLTAVMLWPANLLLLRLARLFVRMLRSMAASRMIQANVSGFCSGIALSIRFSRDRTPVQASTVRKHLQLLSKSAAAMNKY